MTIHFEINGTQYEAAGGEMAVDIEQRLRTCADGGRPVQVRTQRESGRPVALHLFRIDSYLVWESDEHTGQQS